MGDEEWGMRNEEEVRCPRRHAAGKHQPGHPSYALRITQQECDSIGTGEFHIEVVRLAELYARRTLPSRRFSA